MGFGRQGGEGAGDGGVGGHGPVQVGLVAQQCGIGQAVTTQGEGQVGADLAGVVQNTGFAPSGQVGADGLVQAGGADGLGEE